ncbi:MAG TPA: membrane-bound O-acyltransferase family protein [Ruminococcus sp.]|nr:membrane-bound O-acyltransferase family protein [Ruminococcus sp.]
MVFSSLIFLYLFLPVCLLCYGLSSVFKSTVPRNFVLTVFSLIFYAWGEPTYIILLLLSVLVNYFFGLGIGGCQKREKEGGAKALMILSLIFNLGLLGVFKYSGFIAENLNLIPGVNLPVPKLTLPIGISFYTFQILSYIIDLYWEKIDVQRSPFRLLLYISMFPQLIAGPIVRYATIEEEIRERHVSLTDFSEGLTRLIMGLAKKVILANHLSTIVDAFFGADSAAITVAGTWYAVIVYAMQIYFDFSGYSDMAIGMGRMFGFHFDENFRHPFLCKDISEFWQRWHISLGTFFRDYVLYVPIFGKRRKYGGLFLVWFCTGLWHGASWNFIIWGLYFGVFILIEQLIGKKNIKKIPLVIRHIYSKIVIFIGFGIFYFEDLGRLGGFFRNLTGLSGNALIDEATRLSMRNNCFLLAAAVICCFPLYDGVKKLRARYAGAVYATDVLQVVWNAALLIISSVLLVDATNNPFLYFRF